MRATLNIPDSLVKDLVKETKARTKTQAITIAIEEYLRKGRLKKLLSLQGTLDLEDNWQKMEDLELQELRQNGTRKHPR
jgi:hypothetical protein